MKISNYLRAGILYLLAVLLGWAWILIKPLAPQYVEYIPVAFGAFLLCLIGGIYYTNKLK